MRGGGDIYGKIVFFGGGPAVNRRAYGASIGAVWGDRPHRRDAGGSSLGGGGLSERKGAGSAAGDPDRGGQSEQTGTAGQGTAGERHLHDGRCRHRLSAPADGRAGHQRRRRPYDPANRIGLSERGTKGRPTAAERRYPDPGNLCNRPDYCGPASSGSIAGGLRTACAAIWRKDRTMDGGTAARYRRPALVFHR